MQPNFLEIRRLLTCIEFVTEGGCQNYRELVELGCKVMYSVVSGERTGKDGQCTLVFVVVTAHVGQR